MRLSAYDTYALYIALKNHFSQEKYDYFKYRGKSRVSPDTFQQRRDKYQFQKLSRLYNEDEMQEFLVANFLSDTTWVGDLLTDEARDRYMTYQKIKQSLAYSFTNDLDLLFSKSPPELAFKKKSGTYPEVLTLLMRGQISIQTFTILNRYLGLVPRFDADLGVDDIMWSKYRLKVIKLHPFMEYDDAKIKTILKQKVKEHSSPLTVEYA